MDFFLKSDRLGFRNWHIDDFELYKSIWGDKLIAQNLYSAEPKNDDQLQEQLLHEIESVKKHGVQYWPFFLLETGELIGACGLKPYQLFEGVFELNVAVIPKYWNNGLG